MRPKKRILLIDTKEERQSVRRMVLRTWGYIVETAADAESALKQQQERPFDLVISHWPLKGVAVVDMMRQLRKAHPYGRTLVLTGNIVVPPAVSAEVDVLLSGVSPTRLVEECKLMCARKRGPRKQLPEAVAERRSA